jgi:hypothetical protein
MKRAVGVVIAVGLLLGAQGAWSAPRDSGPDCSAFSEVALLARALAEERIDKPRAQAILKRVYNLPDEPARKLARQVLESAYRDSSTPADFAVNFETVCIVKRGETSSLPGANARVRSRIM